MKKKRRQKALETTTQSKGTTIIYNGGQLEGYWTNTLVFYLTS